MRRIAVIGALWLASASAALGQCAGIFPAGSVCGNPTGAGTLARSTTTLNLNPTAGTTNQGVRITQSSPTTGSVQGEFNFNQITATSAVKVLPGSPSSTQAPFADHVASGLKVTLNEGANAGGFQIPILARLNHTVATDIWAGSAASDHIAIASQAYSSASGTGRGLYAASFAVATTPAANHQHIVAVNPEMMMEAGTTVDYRAGVRVQSNGPAKGAISDAAFTVVAVGGATNGFNTGISFSEFQEAQSLSTTGSMFRTQQAMTVANVFNMPNLTTTADIFRFGTVYQLRGTGHTVVTLNSTTEVGFQTSNSNSGGVAGFTALSDLGAGTLADFGVRGSARAAYGALVARDAYVFGNGTTGVTIMADNASGVIKFAAGGNTERGRVAADGGLTWPSTVTGGSKGAGTINATQLWESNVRVVTTAGVREKLTAARTYFVRTDGNDSNTCLVDNAGGACLTIAKAVELAYGLDANIFNVTIQVRSGTFNGFNVSTPHLGSGQFLIQGDTATPSNVHVNSTIQSTNGARIRLAGLRITSAGHGIFVGYGSSVTITGAMEYGTCTLNHITVDSGGSFTSSGSAIAITGGAGAHWAINGPGAAILAQSATYTLTGTPNFSSAFATTAAPGMMTVNANTFSGAATGVRYSATANGVIHTFGAGATYLPGNAAGTTATGGQYI